MTKAKLKEIINNWENNINQKGKQIGHKESCIKYLVGNVKAYLKTDGNIICPKCNKVYYSNQYGRYEINTCRNGHSIILNCNNCEHKWHLRCLPHDFKINVCSALDLSTTALNTKWMHHAYDILKEKSYIE